MLWGAGGRHNLLHLAGATEAPKPRCRHCSHAQVVDALVVSLAKWTVLLNPDALKPSVAFGENAKARLSTEAIFLLGNRWACQWGPSACAEQGCHAGQDTFLLAPGRLSVRCDQAAEHDAGLTASALEDVSLLRRQGKQV